MGEPSEWAKQYVREQKEQREQRMKDKGYREFLKLPQGESEIEITSGPREITGGRFGASMVFGVKYKPKGGRVKEYDLAINKKSVSLLRDLSAVLAEGVNRVLVTRTGSGLDTRYTVTKA